MAKEVFEPCCTWTKGECQDTIEICLPPDFKKEDLSVQFVSANGELQIKGKKYETKTICFTKVINVPNRKLGDIHAKFSNGNLYVTIKKNVCPFYCVERRAGTAICGEKIEINGSGIKLDRKIMALIFLPWLAVGAYFVICKFLPSSRVEGCPCKA